MGLFQNPRKVLPQIVGALCASLGYLTFGAVRGWTSPGLPSLFETGALLDIDPRIDEAWIASTPLLCAIPGALLVAWPLKSFGRKWTMVAMGFPWILGFLLVSFAQNKAMIYAGRVLGGLMEGMVAPAAQVYVTEIASPNIRGVLGSVPSASLALGILISFIVGAFQPWHIISFILIVFPVLFAVSMTCLPESPIWLLTQRKDEEAKRALEFYRGGHTNVEDELQRMRENVEKTISLQASVKLGDFWGGPVLKPLFISLALMFMQQFTAISVIGIYTVKIFALSVSIVDKHMATIIIGAVNALCCFVSSYVVDITGRRILLLISGFIMSVSLFAMGTFYYMKELWGSQAAEASLGWLPLVSLVVFTIGFATGFGTIPFVIMGEIFPLRYRHILCPITSCFFELSSFLSVLTFSDISASFYIYGAFWFYACWAAISVVFVYFCLPETKGKTLEEIEDLFDPGAARRKEFAAGQKPMDRRRSIQAELTTHRRGSQTLVSTIAAATALTSRKALPA